MRILVVGSDKVFSIENFYVKYLMESGVEIIRFVPKNIFYNYYEKSIINRIIFRLELSGIYRTINDLFISVVRKETPSIVWIFKGMEIFPESLDHVKKMGIKLVNYNPDNPFVFTGRGSGNMNITKSIGIYDLHFTYNLAIKEQLERQYLIATSFLPFGFDISDSLYASCECEQEVVRACFLGNPDSMRAEFLLSLADRGVFIDLYGHNWNKFIKHKRISLYPPVYGDEQWKVLRKYRVQLNLMRIHNENSHNMRTFEIPAIGGIQLAPDTPEHHLFFKNFKEIFLFKNSSDCVELINKLLGMTIADASEIRKNARGRCLTSGYSYKDRASQAHAQLSLL